MKQIKIHNQIINVGENQIFHGSDYWQSVEGGGWEPQTFKVLDHFLQSDNELIDIGAWIGPISLYAGKICSKVYAVEPDPVAFSMLMENIKLNQSNNIAPIYGALGINDKPLNVYSPDNKNLFGMSTTNTFGRGFKGIEVPSLTIEQLFQRFGPQNVSLLKMDIEGGEFDIVPACIDFLLAHDITILLATHYPLINDDTKLSNLVDSLKKYKYVLNNEFNKISDVEEYITSKLVELIITNKEPNVKRSI